MDTMSGDESVGGYKFFGLSDPMAWFTCGHMIIGKDAKTHNVEDCPGPRVSDPEGWFKGFEERYDWVYEPIPDEDDDKDEIDGM